MPSKRKFYRTVYKFELLSEEPPDDCMTLEQLHYDSMFGQASGRFLETIGEEVDGVNAACLLLEHGSDPEFFCLTSDGEDLEE